MIGPQTSLASPRELHDSNPHVTPVSDGLIVEWFAPAPQIVIEADGLLTINMPGFDTTSLPGTPRLPFSSVLVVLPPDANPSVKILESTETTELLQAPLKLAEQPGGVQLGSEGQIIGGGFIPASRETIFEAQPVVLEELGIVRGVRLARLTFYPTLSDGESLQVTSHLKVDVQFNAVTISAMAAETSGDPLLAAVNSAVINPEYVEVASTGYRSNSPYVSPHLAGTPPVAIEVSQTGLTEISYQDLQSIDFPVDSVNPQRLHLKRAGEAIAYEWLGIDDAEFTSGEKIRFYADPRFSRWAPFDTYVLSLGGTDGLRMNSRSADPGSWPSGVPWVETLFEENAIYTPECYCAPIPPGRDGDRWIWDRLQRPAPFSGTYQFQLAGVDQSKTAHISIWMIGFTDVSANPDHQIDIAVNGHDLGSRQWDGKNSYQAEFSFSGSWLKDGENTLTITLPLMAGVPVNGVWLDAFSVLHPRSLSESTGADLSFAGVEPPSKYTISLASTAGLSAYDVSDADKPLRLTNFDIAGSSITLADPNDGQSHQYFLTTSSAIQAPDRLRLVAPMRLGGDFEGADYLVISPDEFIPSLGDLIDLRGSNGLQVAVEDVQAIYDAYGDGRPDPDAIYEFLSHAYFTWTQPPIYVLLVGDGTFDPKQYLT
ncbi:MAG: C25 family cysteine peptidase, partial [Anaerolineae bacterium]